jgi:hypothetical protein
MRSATIEPHQVDGPDEDMALSRWPGPDQHVAAETSTTPIGEGPPERDEGQDDDQDADPDDLDLDDRAVLELVA